MKALVNETARDQLFAACAMGRLWKAPGCTRCIDEYEWLHVVMLQIAQKCGRLVIDAEDASCSARQLLAA